MSADRADGVADGGASPPAVPVPTVSVVTPALNAGATVGRAVASVRAQTRSDWEMIVVDDGSTDDTRERVAAAADGDPRVRTVARDSGGASAARNAGVAEARGRYLLFLDADDEIRPDHLAALVALHEKHPDAAFVVSDALKRFADGTAKRFHVGYLAEAPFEVLADYCAPVIHGVLVRRSLVEDVGGYDETLVTCEDWDLWQRVARTGLAVHATGEPSALWHVGPGSLSTNVEQMALDGRRVHARAYAPDPRVPRPAPRLARGLPGTGGGAPVAFLGWCLGQRIAGGEPLDPDVDPLDPDVDLRPSARAFAENVAQGISSRVGEFRAIDAWLGSRDALAAALARRCEAIGEFALGPRLAAMIDEEVLTEAELVGEHALPGAHGVRLDLAGPIDDVIVPAGVATLVVQGAIGRDVVSQTSLPVFDGRVSAAEIFGALADGLKLKRFAGAQSLRLLARPASWPGLAPALWAFGRGLARLVRARAFDRGSLRQGLRRAGIDAARRFFEGRAVPGGSHADRVERARASLPALDGALRAGPDGGPDAAVPLGALERVASLQPEPDVAYDPKRPDAYWESIFAHANPWAYDSDYEQRKYDRTLALLGGRRVGSALELACAEGHFTAMLAPHVDALTAADISHAALGRAAERCAAFAHVDFRQLDFFNRPIEGDYDLIVCSEVLYYADGPTLARVLAKIERALRPGGLFLHAHAFVLYDDPSRTGFDWEGQFGADRISADARGIASLTRVAATENELYRVELYEKRAATAASSATTASGATADRADPDRHAAPAVEPLDSTLDDELAGMIVWGGASATRADVQDDESTASVPVLMLHRVADDAAPGLERYTIRPERLEGILRALRRAGYHSPSLAELDEHLTHRRPFAGRPVILSFDDGYADLATGTWSMVRRNGFGAVVFAVTGLAGRTAEWDAAPGEGYPLMTVDEMRRLAAEGCEFGSHLVTHRSLDLMDNDEVLREAVGSRAALERWLGAAPIAVAPPYGQLTDASRRLLGAAGYSLVFTTDHDVASVFDGALELPRIEVTALDDAGTVLGKMRAPGTRFAIDPPDDRPVEPPPERSGA